ncbi:recombination protein NinG [Gallibacterium anatis]|uniref:recombination protein NinG n=1 Tax=Gallibacterium anatis TaxID=750 RepID=UPI0005321E59|nr:recombination protein NinG [Gallibacterium anatis]KGQ46824.1 recombinase NinG [Gallibacterium anatis]KGQ63483.1 recombinase NinG [Gallibacterium anatis 7990]
MTKVAKCKICKQPYIKRNSLQKVCSVECAIKLSKEQARKKREKLDKQARLESKKRLSALKEENKTKGQLIKETQEAVNRYIRVRDENKECISCGKPLVSERLGGGFDAGHYRSRGSSPYLRFYTLNIHGQCKRCNRYLGGNYHEYRVGLIERLGIKKVEEIEADNRERHYSNDDLRRIKRIFNKKTRLIQRKRG